MRNIVIVDGVRTPFGRLGGGLRQYHTVMMNKTTIATNDAHKFCKLNIP